MAALTNGSREDRRAIALATADFEHLLPLLDLPELHERDTMLGLMGRDSCVLCVPMRDESCYRVR